MANEETVKPAIVKHGAVLKKMPMNYRIDYMSFRDGVPTAVIEVKSRKKGIASTTYPLFMLSLSKWHSGIDYFNKSKLNFVLAGKYDDGIFTYKYSPEDKVEIKWFGGRPDREDKDDQEPCVYVPMKLFKRIA